MLTYHIDPLATAEATPMGFRGAVLATKEDIYKELDKLVERLLAQPPVDATEAKSYIRYLVDSFEEIKPRIDSRLLNSFKNYNLPPSSPPNFTPGEVYKLISLNNSLSLPEQICVYDSYNHDGDTYDFRTIPNNPVSISGLIILSRLDYGITWQVDSFEEIKLSREYLLVSELIPGVTYRLVEIHRYHSQLPDNNYVYEGYDYIIDRYGFRKASTSNPIAPDKIIIQEQDFGKIWQVENL